MAGIGSFPEDDPRPGAFRRCHHCGNVLTQLYDMTPTQAQIDAVRTIALGLLDPRTKAEIRAAIDKLLELHDQMLELHAKFAALTAAAGVGESQMEHIARDIREGRFPQKSAPEDMAAIRNLAHAIERQDAKLTAAAPEEDTSGADMVEQIVAATIERCAQVAEKAGMGEDISVARASIAAAIRDLKDKP